MVDHFSKDTLKKKNAGSLLINPNQLLKKEVSIQGFGFSTGKLLRSVFKDYLIFDDIYEFLNMYTAAKPSKTAIVKYANDQR